MIPSNIVRKLDHIQDLIDQKVYAEDPQKIFDAIDYIRPYYGMMDDSDQYYVEQAYELASKHR